MKKLILPIIFLLLVAAVCAVPAKPGIFEVEQPDGDDIDVQMFGDERGAWIETEDGYTIIQDEGDYWTYAELQNNQLVSTSQVVGEYEQFGEKHLQPEIFTVAQSVSLGERFGALGGDELLPPKGLASPKTNNDTGNLLVILINFTSTGESYTIAYYDGLIFNSSNSTSMWTYYNETSYGNYDLNGSIVNEQNNDLWYASAQTETYYGANGAGCDIYNQGTAYWGTIDHNNACIFMLVREALVLADSQINFSDYDGDSDGVVEDDELVIMVVHTGGDESSSAVANDIWSHKWTMYGSGWNGSGNDIGYNTSDLELDGVRLTKRYGDTGNSITAVGYTMLAEGSPVGTFAHEFGHALGLPDLYKTSSPTDTGVGDWEIMDSGSWNGAPAGSSPAHMSAWSKYFLGWVDPTIITSGLVNATLTQTETSSTGVYMIVNSTLTAGDLPDSGTSEYFLVENRQKVGFDASLPGSGILVWHIDNSVGSINSNNVNNNASHRRVDLEEADGTDTSTNDGDAGDPWNASTTGFNSTSTPNSSFYNNTASNVTVKLITASAATMYAVLGFEGTNIELVPTNVSTPSTLYYGTSNIINITVNNTGTTDATSVLVSVYVNGTYDSNQTATTITANSSEVINFQPNLTYGTYNLTFVVDPVDSIFEDNETNNNISAEITVNYTSPTVSITSPGTNENISANGSVSVNVTDSDDDLNVSLVYYAIGNATNNYTKTGAAGWSSTSTTNNITFTDSFDSTNFADGSYTFYVKANDTTSRQTVDSHSITIDNTNSTINLTIEDTNITTAGGSDINCTATDSGSGVKNVTIYAEDHSSGETTTCNAASCLVDYDPDSAGSKTVTCTVYDFAGNVNSTSGTITVTAVAGDDDDDDDTTTTSSLDSGLTEDWLSKLFATITAGQKVSWTIPSSGGLDVNTIELTTKHTLTNVRLKARKLDSKPSTISGTPAGTVHQYFQMSTTGISASSITLATFKFKIPISWFTSNTLDENSVSLRRWSGNGWTKLSTNKYKSDTNYHYYSATSTSFSYFAISALTGSISTTGDEELEGKLLGSEEDGSLTALGTGAVTSSLTDFLSHQTFGMDNLYWVIVFGAIVSMFVFLVVGVNNQQNLRPRPGSEMFFGGISRWKLHSRKGKRRRHPITPPSYSRMKKTQKTKPTSFFSPSRRGRRR